MVVASREVFPHGEGAIQVARGSQALAVFDHAVVNVLGEMDGALRQYERLGFRLTPRGFHTLGSINHLAVFGASYLELLGYAPGEREKRAELWVHPPGLTGLAFRTQDAAALRSAMREAGVAVEPCRDFSRPVEIDGMEHEAHFRTFQLDRGEVLNGRIFFCQHRTPELLWRAEFQEHPNGVTGIAGAFVACDDPERLPKLLRVVPGLSDEGSGGIRAGQTRLCFARGDALEAYFGEVALAGMAGRPMRMVALELACRSLARVVTLLDAGGIEYAQSHGWLQVGPEQACGLVLRFIEQA